MDFHNHQSTNSSTIHENEVNFVTPMLVFISIVGFFGNMIVLLVFIRLELIRKKNFSLDGILSTVVNWKTWALYRKPPNGLSNVMEYGTVTNVTPPPTPTIQGGYHHYTCTNLILVPPHIQINPIAAMYDPPARCLRRMDTVNSLRKEALLTSNGFINQKLKLTEEKFRFGQEIPHFFTFTQAAADLAICLLVIPVAAYLLAQDFYKIPLPCCQIFMFINTSLILYSSLVTIAIALERFLSICHPFKRVITNRISKLSSLIIAIICLIISVVSAFSVEMSPNGFCCHDNDTATYKVVIKLFTSIFIVCMITVLILYGRIWILVIKIRKNGRKLDIEAIIKRRACVHPLKDAHIHPLRKRFYRRFVQQQHVDPNNSSLQTRPHSDLQLNKDNKTIKINSPLSNPTRKFHKRLPQIRDRYKGHHVLKNIRTAFVLFTSAILYILTFTPALLVWNNIINKHYVLSNLYYINNASNPIVYLLLSKNFRSQLMHLFIHRQSLEESILKQNFTSNNRKKVNNSNFLGSMVGSLRNGRICEPSIHFAGTNVDLLEPPKQKISTTSSCPEIITNHELDAENIESQEEDISITVITSKIPPVAVEFCIDEMDFKTKDCFN